MGEVQKEEDTDALIASTRSILAVGRRGLHGHGVQLALPLLRDLPAAVLVLLDEPHLLELLKDVPRDLPRAFDEDVGANSASLLPAIHLAEATDAHSTSKVDLADHGC